MTRQLCAAILLAIAAVTTMAGADMEPFKNATFGAGCFWGVEKIFSKVPGVVETEVGYMGGRSPHPTYREVCADTTGHAEVVQVTYDPSKVSYEELLITFWEWHDPTTPDRQGPDVGSQYRSVIFTADEAQAAAARRSKEILEKAKAFRGRIVTQIVPAGEFWRAEESHQDYLVKDPDGYCSHHLGSPKIRQVLETQLVTRR